MITSVGQLMDKMREIVALEKDLKKMENAILYVEDFLLGSVNAKIEETKALIGIYRSEDIGQLCRAGEET